jgi:hypothetical protein
MALTKIGRQDVLFDEIIAVSTSAIGVSPPAGKTVHAVFIENTGAQPIRYRNGAASAPTATTGHKLAAGEALSMEIDPTSIRFIQDSTATGAGEVTVTYFGQ